MKRFLALTLGITLTSLTIGTASLGAMPDSGSIASPASIVDDSKPTTQFECYWIYLSGHWICIS
jgi:hypothetical protein